MKNYDYDLIVIGAGSGGVRASRLAAGYGAKVAIIEESRYGGTCVIRGCVPKKILVYGSMFASSIEDSRGFGWSLTSSKHNWESLIGAKDKELDRLENIYINMLKNAGVDLIAGQAKVCSENIVEVKGRKYSASKILIAVGGKPFIPDFPGKEFVITSNEALDLKACPKNIIIVGGGYIALEFAGIFNSLGAKVDIVLRSNKVLTGFDLDIRDTITSELNKRGILIHNNQSIKSLEKNKNGQLKLELSRTTLISEKVMFATGRKPNTCGLGIKEVGVNLDKNGAVLVDAMNCSSIKSIFAIGDVTDRINLTPVAINEGRVFAETFYNKNPLRLDYDNIASAVFSQPQIATVGLTEEQARIDFELDIYISRFNPMKNTISGRNEPTMMKIIVDKKTDKVLGCHMVGDDAAEIIQGIAIALKCGATKKQFDETVGIHPTSAEEFVTMRQIKS
ncbi:MAG: glutathione-disulfide reductase [Pseudomonadota bacterium]|nr:glutathione-disulfide reductase [Pseudomonadota bacterium]